MINGQLEDDKLLNIIALHEKSTSPDRFIAISLAYRLLDDYKREKQIVDHGLQIAPHNHYLREREVWHALPKHQKMVARMSLSLDKNPEWTPRYNTIDQLCFVTIGGGKRVFRDMVESLESLRNTPTYKDHPIYVVDTGLNEYQKEFLKGTFDIKEFYNPKRTFGQFGEKQQSWLSIAHFPDFFPRHRYYFHLECDTWIQDERSIDKLLVLCEKQGWAMDGWNIGIYCIDSVSDYLEKWQAATMQNPSITEKSGNNVYRSHDLKFLKDLDGTQCPDYMFRHTRPAAPIGMCNNNLVWHTGLPLLNSDKMLVDSVTLAPVGIFHCHKPCQYIRELNYKVISRFADVPLDENDWKRHIQISRKQLAQGPETLNCDNSIYNKIISMRYRTFPWKDKFKIAEQLEKFNPN